MRCLLVATLLALPACAGTSPVQIQRDTGTPDSFPTTDILRADWQTPPHDGPMSPDDATPDGPPPPDSAAPVPYGDVPPSHPQYQQIQWVSQQGIMIGCQSSPPAFCPDAPLTRTEAAVSLVRMKHGDSFSYSPTPHFSDVGTGHWAFKYVQRLADDNVTQGCGNGQFCPDSSILRRQWAVFLFNTKTL